MTQPTSQTFVLPDTAATTAMAHAIASVAKPSLCILLEGPIGAGKTFLARAVLHRLMRQAGNIEDVPSPTFTLVQTYEVGDLDVWHADLYRLASPDELIELGLDVAFEQAFCMIEWPDRMGDMAPIGALRIFLEPSNRSETERTAVIEGPPDLVARLGAQLKDPAP